jgi:hypothetical protein
MPAQKEISCKIVEDRIPPFPGDIMDKMQLGGYDFEKNRKYDP